MEKTIDQKIIYENDIEMYFLEYFENRGIDTQGTDFLKIPNSVFNSAFMYVNKKVIKPNGIHPSNGKTPQIIDTLEELTGIYINLVNAYNITSFPSMFCYYLGISRDTLYTWLNNIINNTIKSDTNGEDVTSRLHKIAKTIFDLSGETVRNKLSDDRTGAVVLANNDTEVGLEYTKQKLTNVYELQARYTLADISQLIDKKD